MAETLESEVSHVGLLVAEVATEEVASPHLKAWVTGGRHTSCICY